MVNRTLLRQFDLSADELKKELDDAFSQEELDWLPAEEQEFRDNRVVTGKVRKVMASALVRPMLTALQPRSSGERFCHRC